MFPKYLDADIWKVIYPFNSVFSISESLPHIALVFVFVSEILFFPIF